MNVQVWIWSVENYEHESANGAWPSRCLLRRRQHPRFHEWVAGWGWVAGSMKAWKGALVGGNCNVHEWVPPGWGEWMSACVGMSCRVHEWWSGWGRVAGSMKESGWRRISGSMNECLGGVISRVYEWVAGQGEWQGVWLSACQGELQGPWISARVGVSEWVPVGVGWGWGVHAWVPVWVAGSMNVWMGMSCRVHECVPGVGRVARFVNVWCDLHEWVPE